MTKKTVNWKYVTNQVLVALHALDRAQIAVQQGTDAENLHDAMESLSEDEASAFEDVTKAFSYLENGTIQNLKELMGEESW